MNSSILVRGQCAESESRRPRTHPVVKERLNVLLRCVERMPATGPLFTSQAPFFPIVIMALLFTRAEERQVARDWFDTVVAGGNCRSVGLLSDFLFTALKWPMLTHLFVTERASGMGSSTIYVGLDGPRVG